MANEILNVRATQGNHSSGWVLRVEGEMMVYSGGAVEIVDLPDGFNPTIAMFRVHANEAGGPMKGQPIPFTIDRVTQAGKYRQVQLNPGEDNGVTFDILDVKTIV